MILDVYGHVNAVHCMYQNVDRYEVQNGNFSNPRK